MRSSRAVLLAMAVVSAPCTAAAQGQGGAPAGWSEPVAIALALAVIGLLPLAFMGLTAFVKISTVLAIARSALGAQSIPSNVVLLALSAALTLVAMAPVGTRLGERLTPLFERETAADAGAFASGLVNAVRDPLRRFFEANSSETERSRFYELARNARPPPERGDVRRDDLSVVMPAFVVTELVEAFALGFAIYLPFLVIDLVVANILVALGLTSMSPAQASLPFKLLLFVAADGWGLLAEALVSGYAAG